MRVSTQQQIDRFLGTIICKILSFFYIFSRKNSRPEKIEKILVILLSEIGALVLAYPMLKKLKGKYPHASLNFLVFEKNREILELFGFIPKENVLTLNNESMIRFTKDIVRILAEMRKIKLNVVIDCELFSRITSILSFLSGARIRVGFHPFTQEGLFRGNFINRPVLYNPYHHISQQFLTLVEAIDSTTHPKAKRIVDDERLEPPKIKFKPDEINKAMKRLHNYAPCIKGRKAVLIYPSGGLLPIRAWPREYYSQLAKELTQKGYAVGIIGLKEDKNIAKEILFRCQNANCVDLTGYTRTIRELLMIFHRASLLITNDGGPGQFAAMTSTPAIILYGPETPTLYGTLNENAFNFYLSLSCSPCLTAYNHRRTPCNGDNLCLKKIPPHRVLAKALEILKA
ncbi:MAG: glycosyltransferase family 9 protein [Candidatus Aminicenantales bacterium]